VAALRRPTNQLDVLLVDLWSEVLGRCVGIDDPLAELGATPDQRARLLVRIEQDLGCVIPADEWDPPGTIAALSAVMVRLGVPAEDGFPLLPPTGPTPRPRAFVRHADGTRPPLIFLHGDLNGGGFYCLNLAAKLGASQPFYALGPHGPHGVPIPDSIEAIAEDQLVTLRAMQPRGPYRLAGHCNGGVVAFEMARRLEAQGEKVAILVMIATDVRSTATPLSERSWSHRLRYYWSRLRPAREATPASALPEPGSPGARAVAERRRLQAERFAAYAKLLWAYRPGPFDGRVVLLWPRDDEQRHPGDKTQGWGKVAPRLTVQSVPGEHLSCVTTHVSAVVSALRQALDQG
jgi:thioesterase domain-containing protein